MEARPLVAQGDGWMIVLDEDGELCTLTPQAQNNNIESSFYKRGAASAGHAEKGFAVFKFARLVACGFVLIASLAFINSTD